MPASNSASYIQQIMIEAAVGISVLLPAAATISPATFRRAHRSVVDQTTLPDEVVIVTNQQLATDLEDAINEIIDSDSITRHEHVPETAGLGGALQAGLENCSRRFVARMDADDVALPDRFDRQLPPLLKDNVDIVGTQLAEFRDDPDQPEATRRVPTSHEDIADTMSWRCPLNHPTTMFDRKAVLSAGGYRDFPYMEDWDLWARCLAAGLCFRNLDETLVRAHVDKLAYRRGGIGYARAEIRIARELRRLGIASRWDSLRHLVFRVPPRLMPPSARQLVYRMFARRKFP